MLHSPIVRVSCTPHCEDVGLHRIWGYLPGRSPLGINNRLRNECLNRNHWTSLLEARVVIEDFKDDHNHRHRHSSRGYLTSSWGSLPHAGPYAAKCTHIHQPVGGREID